MCLKTCNQKSDKLVKKFLRKLLKSKTKTKRKLILKNIYIYFV